MSHDRFLITFPVYVLTYADGQIINLNYAGGIVAVATFTDEDLAQRFLTAAAQPEFKVASLRSPQAYLHLLELSAHHGTTHVTFDPRFGEKITQHLLIITDLIRDLEKQCFPEN